MTSSDNMLDQQVNSFLRSICYAPVSSIYCVIIRHLICMVVGKTE